MKVEGDCVIGREEARREKLSRTIISFAATNTA
jgi:hypothetical protein